MKLKLLQWTRMFQDLHRTCNQKWPCCTALAVLAQTVFFVYHQTPAWSQTQWIRYNQNPVVDVGTSGAWDQSAVADRESISTTTEFGLLGNYPNPFNPSTDVRYSLAQAEHVSLKIYNLAGQEITTLIEGKQSAGEHQIQWRANGVPSGIYFCRLQAGELVQSRKMILMK